VTIAFNSAMMACSTFITFIVMERLFGDLPALREGPFSVRFVAALYVMALLQYGSNSILAAIHSSLKMQEPVWRTWRKYYLWASISFFAGASVAGITAQFTDSAGFYALVACTPIVAIVYFTYRTYLQNIEVMAAAARAEEAAAHAAEAERHVAIQAAIALQHDQAPVAAATDWARIAELYTLLAGLTGSVVVESDLQSQCFYRCPLASEVDWVADFGSLEPHVVWR
jgi:hypothetical protein